jgi:hypothetical protein
MASGMRPLVEWVGRGQTTQVAVVLKRARGDDRVVIQRLLDPAAKGLGLDSQAAPGGHGAAVAEHFRRAELNLGHERRVGLGFRHARSGALQHVAGAAKKHVGQGRAVGDFATKGPRHALSRCHGRRL